MEVQIRIEKEDVIFHFRRFSAALIDWGILFTPFAVVIILGKFFGMGKVGDSIVKGMLLVILPGYIPLQYKSMMKNGTTIGKRFVKLKVIYTKQKNFTGIDVDAMAIRLIVNIVSCIFYGIPFLLCLINKRQTLGEVLSKTLTVSESNLNLI